VFHTLPPAKDRPVFVRDGCGLDPKEIDLQLNAANGLGSKTGAKEITPRAFTDHCPSQSNRRGIVAAF
jgi:hypothetical protein